MDLNLKRDHVGGGFNWEVEPKCTCGLLKPAIEEEQMIFVSNFTNGGFNVCYMMPLEAEGTLARTDGVTITHCPWCGDKIECRKRYP